MIQLNILQLALVKIYPASFVLTCKWMLCLVKSRGLHKSTKEDFAIMGTLRPYSSWTTRS